MTTEEVKRLKTKVKAEMLRRNGFGSVKEYGDSTYDFTVQPTKGGKVLAEYGEKTVDLLLKIENFKDLKPTKSTRAIPRAFSTVMIDEIDRLSQEVMTGESEATVRDLFPDRDVETSSCRGDCTGLCVGSCINNCNGCTGCTTTCGSGCDSGCSGCSGNCEAACLGATKTAN